MHNYVFDGFLIYIFKLPFILSTQYWYQWLAFKVLYDYLHHH